MLISWASFISLFIAVPAPVYDHPLEPNRIYNAAGVLVREVAGYSANGCVITGNRVYLIGPT